MKSATEKLTAIVEAALDAEQGIWRLKALQKEFLTLDIQDGTNTPFIELIKRKERDAFKRLLSISKNKNNAVHAAAIDGDVDFVEELIVQGASPNAAVRGAALGAHFELVKQLLDRGAIRSQAAYGAAEGAHFGFVREFMASDVDIKNFAVAGAALGEHFGFVKELLAKGAVFEYAITAAARGAHDEIVQWLLAEDNSNDYDAPDIWSAAEGAAEGGHIESLDGFLKKGAILENASIGAAKGGHVYFLMKALIYGASLISAEIATEDGWQTDLRAFFGNHQSREDIVINLAIYQGMFEEKHGVLEFLREIETKEIRQRYAIRLVEKGLYKGDIDSILGACDFVIPQNYQDQITVQMLCDFSKLDKGVRTWFLQDDFVLPERAIPSDASNFLPNLNEDEIIALRDCMRMSLDSELFVKQLTEFLKTATDEEKSIVQSLISELKQTITPQGVFDVITRKLTEIKKDTMVARDAVPTKFRFFRMASTIDELVESYLSQLQQTDSSVFKPVLTLAQLLKNMQSQFNLTININPVEAHPPYSERQTLLAGH